MHWEWRGFGSISEGFLQRYEALPMARDWQEVTDVYFCLEGDDLNLKLRSGAEDGLKLKRRIRRSGDLELWTERLEDIRLLPMTFAELGELAREAGFRMPDSEVALCDREMVVDLLSHADPTPHVVTVEKHRETHRLWEGESGILVELAEISAPQRIGSLAVQNILDLEDASPEDVEGAEALVRRALKDLGILAENLEPSSYVHLVRSWATTPLS